MFGFRQWRERRILARDTRFAPLWPQVTAAYPLLGRLSAAESARLRDLAVLFLHRIAIDSTGHHPLDDLQHLTIAAMACLPVLGIGLDAYHGWYSVVVYPDVFVSDHESVDEDGVVHHVVEERSGESWERGPVLLDWKDVVMSGRLSGYNVVIHEAAHRLDGGNGALDGLPALPAGMSLAAWSEGFGGVYEELCAQVDNGEETAIDPYAAESPAEFFAVISELFFEMPALLAESYPEVYDQLRAYYRQDPAARHCTGSA